MNLVLKTYQNGRPAIEVFDEEGFPHARLTTNLVDEYCNPNETFLDTNNVPDAEDYLKNAGIDYAVTGSGKSGYCIYPKIVLLNIKQFTN